MEINFYQTQSGRSPIEDFILDLSKSDQARFTDVFEGNRKIWPRLSRVQFKPLRGKLWEIKFNAKSGGFRIAYVIFESSSMTWLHTFKKTTQKTSLNDLAIAEKRMKEVLGL